jgi:hypothetical protein
MSSVNRNPVVRKVVKPLIVALGLAVPGAASFATAMHDAVTTRADQSVAQKYGRDSVYGFSPDATPYNAEQQGARGMAFIGDVFHSTADFFSTAWDKTASLFKSDNGSDAATTGQELQPYGRAGGYIGSDRVELVSEASRTYAADSREVRSGEDAATQANSTTELWDQQPAERPNIATEAPKTDSSRATVAGGAQPQHAMNAVKASDRSTVYPEDRKLTPNDSGPNSNKQATSGAVSAPATDRSAVYPEDRKLMPTASSRDSASAMGPVDQRTTYPEDRTLTPAVSDTQSAEDMGRTSGRRFDHPQEAHGQAENETVTR